MKLVQINAVYKISSTGRTTEELHEHCQVNGIGSYVFCANWDDKKNGIFRIGNKLDYKIHAMLSRLTGWQAWFSYFPTKRLLRQLNQIKPDVIILRNLHGNYINLPLLLNYIAKHDIPTVAVMHDCWYFTGHCTHYTAHKCYNWQSECKSCKLIKADNNSWFFDTSRPMFNRKKELFDAIPRLSVIGVSKWITSEAKKSVILRNAKIFRTVYNWIDTNKFYPRNTERLKQKIDIKDEFVVLGVAQGWSYRKGISHFIKLAEARPEIMVILVGTIAEKIDAPSNLKIAGPTSNIDELAEYYSLADVLLVCSLQETFGKVSAEALACGTPVIANNATANPEIAGTECGISVNNNDNEEILRAVDKIRELGKGFYSEKCIERAKKNFSKDTQAAEYIKLAIDTINCE